jgi:hypothetical protein
MPILTKIGAFLGPYKLLIYLGLAIGIAVASFRAGWTANGHIKDNEILSLKLEAETLRANQNKLAFDDLYKSATQIKNAANAYVDIQDKLSGKIAKLEKEFKNATKTPLPVDCVPDDARMRSLTDTIDAANQAISGQ